MAVFVNVSNHPSEKWEKAQKDAAGDVVDVAFPNVPPEATEEEIELLAEKVCEDVVNKRAEVVAWYERQLEDTTYSVDEFLAASRRVLVQGEFSLCNEIWRRLGAMGFQPVVATSARESVDLGDGKKTTVFKFVKFRRIRV
jgi:hypothetical protein